MTSFTYVFLLRLETLTHLCIIEGYMSSENAFERDIEYQLLQNVLKVFLYVIEYLEDSCALEIPI